MNRQTNQALLLMQPCLFDHLSLFPYSLLPPHPEFLSIGLDHIDLRAAKLVRQRQRCEQADLFL